MINDYFSWVHDNVVKLSAIATSVVVLWKPVANMRKFFKNFSDLHAKISAIEAEIKPNGGKSIKDVTAQMYESVKDIKKQLLVLEQSHKVVLDSVNIGYWKADIKGEWVEVGKKLVEITGRSETDLLGNNWTVWLAKEDKQRVMEAVRSSVIDQTLFDETFSFIKQDKTLQKVIALAYPVKDGTEVIGYYGTIDKV